MIRSKRFHRIVSIFNHLEVKKEFTKYDLLSLVKGFYPSAKIDNMQYFFTVMRMVNCCTIIRDCRGKKAIYRKERNIDSDDLKLAHLTYVQKQLDRQSKKNIAKITESIPIVIDKTISEIQIQKVIETCLILTKQNEDLKNEIEQLKKSTEDLKKENLFNMLIKKAEEATGIHVYSF